MVTFDGDVGELPHPMDVAKRPIDMAPATMDREIRVGIVRMV
jgi:hypothetical protein